MVNYKVKFSGSLRFIFGEEINISSKKRFTVERLLDELININKKFSEYVKYEGNNIVSPLLLIEGKNVDKKYLINESEEIFIVRRSLGG